MCNFCRIDDLNMHDFPCCFVKSLLDFWDDLTSSKNISCETFTRNDRIYYILFAVILVIVLYGMLTRNLNQQSNNTFGELSGGWNPYYFPR